MAKSSMIRARTEPSLKLEVDRILHKLGLSCSEAINLFFTQIILRKGIPFNIALPNTTTLKAIKDVEKKKVTAAKHSKHLFEKLEI